MGLILAAAVGVSVFYVSKLELDSKSIKDENTVIAKLLKKDTKVLAPLTFIFDEIDNHEISGLHYYRYFHNRYKKIKEPNSIENVFIDSRQKAIDYVLLDRQNLSPLPIPTTTPTGYTLIFDNARWMVFESKTK